MAKNLSYKLTAAVMQWPEREVAVADLKPYERNPRKISAESFDRLVEKIQRNGYHQRIMATHDLRVIGGHQRIKALQKLGIETIKVITPEQPISDEQFKELVVTDNLQDGEFDFAMLAEDYDRAALIDWGMPEEWLPDEASHGYGGGTDEDDVPEAPVTPVTVLGDVWLLGDHRVMCGDSTQIDDVEKLMAGQKADMVFTDPPYGVNIVNVGTSKAGSAATKFKTASVGGDKIADAKQYAPIIGDDTTETARNFYQTCLATGMENFIIFGGNYFTDFLPPSPCWVVWDKQNSGNFADVELAWASHKGGAKLYSHLWNGLARKGDHKTELSTRVHPTQKPVGLFEEIFKDFKFSVCFDGFLGSGSTLIAAEKTGRICCGMELSPAYCDVIVKRWQEFTGKTATNEATGDAFAAV